MTLVAAVRPHRYADSVRLMAVASALEQEPGVRRAALFMATPANVEFLRGEALLPQDPLAAGPDDLIIAVDAADPTAGARAMERADRLLQGPPGASASLAARTVEAAAAQADATVACISVPGEYAAVEAFAALAAGLHVFCFSDRVPLEEEIALKREARRRGLLMMGPDCGTAYLQGVGLGFHNAVRSGSVGIVAASGTGLQEAACLLHRWGVGVSQGIGTGGRDLLDAVGGITTEDAIDLLAAEPSTRVILLLAKAADKATTEKVLQRLGTQSKSAVACLLGARASAGGVLLQPTIRAAAAAAARSVGAIPPPPAALPVAAAREGRVVGLFSGGSMLAQAEGVMGDALAGDQVGPLTDFGSEAFTRGRAHPMVDPRPRAAALQAACQDSGTAVLLFDVMLGFGAHPDPAQPLARALAGCLPEGAVGVAALCGTDQDPQSYPGQRAQLEAAGVIVFESMAEAAGAAALAVRQARVGR